MQTEIKERLSAEGDKECLNAEGDIECLSAEGDKRMSQCRGR